MAPISSFTSIETLETTPPSLPGIADDASPILICKKEIETWRVTTIVLSCLIFLSFLTSLFLFGRVMSLNVRLTKGKYLKKEAKHAAKTEERGTSTSSYTSLAAGESSSPQHLRNPLSRFPIEEPDDYTDDGHQAIINERNLASIPPDDTTTTTTTTTTTANTSGSRTPLIARRFSRQFNKGKGVDRSGFASNNTAEAGPSSSKNLAGDEDEPSPEERKPGWIAAYFTGPAWTTRDRSEGWSVFGK